MKNSYFPAIQCRVMRCAALLAACLVMLPPLAGAAEQDALHVSAECDNGLPDGAYRVESAQGRVRIEGTYAAGLREGDFVFYTASGDRIILLPYTRGLLHGTVKAWQAGATDADAALKLVSDISAGFVNGRHQTWYDNGQPRSDFVVKNGDITAGETWNPDGTPLEINDTSQFLNTEIENDFNYFERLEQVMDAYPPAC